MSSSQLPLRTSELPDSEQQLYEDRAASLRLRRAAASRVRRRRLLVLDLAIGAGLAVFGLIAAPGLAILALAAFLALGVCVAWLAAERLRARRRAAGGVTPAAIDARGGRRR